MAAPRIIGLNGYRGAGKDAAGEVFVRQGYTRAKFADLLYDSAAALFGVPRADWEAWKNEDVHIVVERRFPAPMSEEDNETLVDLTWRAFMQRYGTEAHRDVFSYDFWIEQCFKRLRTDTAYVFTDARFDNELTAIRMLDGKNVRIERPGLEVADAHASEALPSADLLDAYLFNDGTLEDLEGKVKGLLGTWGAHV